MSKHPTWTGLGQGMLVLAALWWAWGAYAWLTNYIAAEEDRERLLMFAVMGAFLVAALAVPNAFGDDALLFAVAYAVARWLHIFIFAEANDDLDAAEAIRRLARTALPAPALLIAAAFLDGTAQALVWALALAIDFAGPYVFGVSGFRVSPGAFRRALLADRDHRARRVDRRDRRGARGELDAGVVAAALLGLVIACGFGGRTSTWWRSCPSATSATRGASACSGSRATRTATCTCR